jgi:hypothetical protein
MIAPALALMLSALMLTACMSASALRVDVTDAAAFDPQDREVVLLSQTAWDAEIRRTLALRGFTVKRFPATRSIERDVSPSERERFREAEARYGLTVYLGRVIDHCTVNQNVKYGNIVYEVADLRRNIVVATVQQGGGTGRCAWHDDHVFDDLAEALARVWSVK